MNCSPLPPHKLSPLGNSGLPASLSSAILQSQEILSPQLCVGGWHAWEFVKESQLLAACSTWPLYKLVCSSLTSGFLLCLADSDDDGESEAAKQLIQPIAEKIIAKYKAKEEEAPLLFFVAGEVQGGAGLWRKGTMWIWLDQSLVLVGAGHTGLNQFKHGFGP